MNRGSDGAAFAPGAAGQPTASNLPPHLARPEVRAALEATRAKFAMQQQQQQNGSSGLGATLPASAYQQQQQQQQGSIPAGRGPAIAAGRSTEQQQQQQQQQAGAYRVNPMFGEAAVLSPDKKVDREYTPRLADAICTPSLDALVPGASLPPVGDLFADQPELPLSAEAVQHTAPKLPDWDTQRASLTGRSLWDEAVAHSRAGGAAKEDDSKPQVLETYPPHVQESLLVDDLLSAFMGENGSYVRAKLLHAPGGTRLGFEVVGRGQLEAALQEMTARMLPLCEYAAVIQRFVETRRRYAWGLVCQALAGAMRHVLQDWHLMVAQLEHQLRSGKLTLHALWYYVQPPMSALKLVASLAAEASFGRLRGAGLLDLLHSRCAAAMGDAAAHRLALRLLKAAAEPYFSMLERWLCEGAVDDPYAEFMVVQDASIQRESLNADNQSAFWHDRYTLRLVYAPATAEGPEQPPPTPALGQQQPMQQQGRHPPPQQYDVPAFLMRQRDLILNTGKYLNVMRECGTKPPRTLPLGTRLEYDEGSKCVLAIKDAHTTASSAAMELLRRRENLAGGLAVLKRYFLAAQGDMLLHLMDAAEPELHAFVGNVPLLQLQSLLDSAVRGSSAASDPAAARLAVAFDHRSILNMLIANQQALALVPGAEASSKTPFSKLKPTTPAPMTASERNNIGKKRSARESFMLSYEVPWPLSIAAPQAALAQYQMVFRHIFELKWVERELTRVAALYQQTAGLANRRVRMRRASLGGGSRLSGGGGDQLSEALAQSCAACQLMTHFFRQYLMYVTFEVMEPLWAAFEAKLQTASSLDEIVEQHKAFLRRLMKGCLLSRKVVVLRALLGLKDLALRFVRLSDDTASLKWDALEEEAEQKCMGTGRKAEGRREQRLLKTSLARAQLELQLSRPEVAAGIRDLRTKFLAKAGEFMAALADAHRTAHSERSDTREELESLLNLMSRLDFNGYFSAQPPPAARPAPAAGLASGGGDRMTVRFGAAA